MTKRALALTGMAALSVLFIAGTAFAVQTLLSDTFSGTTINTALWSVASSSSGTIAQNNGLTIGGNNAWATNYVSSKQLIPRGQSLVAEAVVKVNSTNQFSVGLGYGDAAFINTGSEAAFINFNSQGQFKIFHYLNGSSAEEYLTTTAYQANVWYKLQAVVGDTTGIRFKVFKDNNGDGDFNDAGESTDLLASTSNSLSANFSNKPVFFSTYSAGRVETLKSVTVSNSAPDSISVTSPKAYQVFQRSPGNTGAVTISGTYTGSPTSIEAQWKGGAWTTIATSTSGGTWSGTLLTGIGQGTLNVRFTNDTAASTTVPYVGVGDIFVIAGQSNASGRGTNNQTYSNASLKAMLFGNDDHWKDLSDPTDSGVGQVDHVSDDTVNSPGGSVWPLVATLMMQNTNVPVAFIPTALGGSSIAAWQKSGLATSTLYGSMYRRIQAAGGQVKGVLFWQGETDAQNGTDQATYQTLLNAFVDAVWSDFAVPTMVAQIGDFSTTPGAQLDNVRQAQRAVWGGNVHARRGPVLYDVNISDTVHFVSDAELQTAANRWWTSMRQELYGLGDGRGPRLLSAEHSTSTVITLRFTEASLPLLPQGTLSGFTVKSGGVAITPLTAAVTATDTVTITLPGGYSDPLTVSLGEGHSGKGATVPTDSSGFSLPADIFIDAPVSPVQ